MKPLDSVRNYLSRVFQGVGAPGTTGGINRVVGRLIGAEVLPDGPAFRNVPSPSPVVSPSPVAQVAPPMPSPQINAPAPVANNNPLSGLNPSRGTPNPEIMDFIQKASQTYGIDPSLLAAQLFTESGFNPQAQNTNSPGNTDRGIAQINNRAYPEVTDSQAYDPQFGVNFMAKHLSKGIKKFGKSNIDLAIASYNVGRGGLESNMDAARKYQAKVWKSLTPEKAYQLQMATPSANLLR